MSAEAFGSTAPFCEPLWYSGAPSPYYKATHREWRARMRRFVTDKIVPYVDEWLAKGYPNSLHEEAYAAGINGCLFPKEYGGTPPEEFDAFHELILWDELANSGGNGVLGQLGIDSMAMPPIIKHGTDHLKELVVRQVTCGKKHCSLAISEPTAGSDVSNIKCTAEKVAGGYLVNGQKKWITGGLMADYFTLACRTGAGGAMGISLLMLEKDMPGIKIRKMETQHSSAHNTTFITLDDVKVPEKNLIGKEGHGFRYLMLNFNHERFVIAAGATRSCRLCYSEALHWAVSRKTFGKRLVDHQIIRYKLAEMARLIETLQDSTEKVAYQISQGVPDSELGGTCALLKVQASRTFEHCAREASQIFGGSSIVKEGKGAMVERLYREVRASAIPGGSEEILLDFAIRQVVAKM